MPRQTKTSSRQNYRLVDFDPATFDGLPCCGIKSPTHPGRRQKQRWLEAHIQSGLRARTLLLPDGKPVGYIEYLPGESAWRGVDAGGYMFIHCILVHSKQHQGEGLGAFMIDACLDDAKKAGMNGVAVLVRQGPWLADRRLFVANGFRPVGSAPPDYELLVRKFKASAPDPAIRKSSDLKAYGKGLTIVRSSQCPFIEKFAAEIADSAEKDYGIKPAVVDISSCKAAHNGPTPYAAFAVIYNGELLADHQISRTRFRNIMNKVKKQRSV